VLEMMAVHNALQAFLPILLSKAVQFRCDNIATVAHLNNMGGWSEAMTAVARSIHRLCKREAIQMTASYLLGLQNTVADKLSCLHLSHEWQLALALFHCIDRRWGPHTIDRTVSASNTQLPRFNSQFVAHGSGRSSIRLFSPHWRSR
jgi:hypothetical protein